MKSSIKNEIYCNHENLDKFLPSQYAVLVSKSYYKRTCNLIWFNIDKNAVTSSEIIKAQKKIINTKIMTLYFARCFTIEAVELINESNGTAFYLHDFPWFDERFNRIRGGNR